MASLGVTPIGVPHETLDRSAELGLLSPGVSIGEAGSIGGGPDGAADVVWYSFTLGGPARVQFELSREDPSSTFNGVLSLFNNDPTSYDFGDPYNIDGHRLLDQVDGKADGGVASFDQELGQGTYYLAVSGDGNFDFHPLIAGSGLPGSTGDFQLQVTATDAGLSPSVGPQVLSSDPAPGSVLGASPLAIRVELTGVLDPSTLIPGQTAELLYSPDGNFALDGQQVALSQANFSAVTQVANLPGDNTPQYDGLNELQLFPANPLGLGDYEVVLVGQSVEGSPVLADLNGTPVGANAANPQGQDITIPFQVDGVEGQAGVDAPDDTASTAQQLGQLTPGSVVQVAGAIGTDPFGADTSYVPGNQVDLYHFTVTGADESLVAEVFAGRIGSPLDPGVSLFRLEPDGTLQFVGGNNNTGDNTVTDDGLEEPLLTDSALYASLTPGEYYVAVAGGLNTPSPLEGQIPGSFGVYDPNTPGSAQLGWSTGNYVLNLLVQPTPAAPHVVSSSPAAGSTLTQDPTQVVITFDQPMDLADLALQSYMDTYENYVSGIFIEGSDGTIYVPRFDSYNSDTNQATFDMLQGLPNGQYELHISGVNGVSDVFGSPIAGNDPSGDYVIPFAVDVAPRGDGGNPRTWIDQEPNDGVGQAQDIGVLFPNDLAAGVTITRNFSGDPAAAPHDTADFYQFQLLLDKPYTFALTGNDLPAGVMLSLTDASGQVPQGIFSEAGGTVLFGELAPGTYDLEVSGWNASEAASLSYQVRVTMSSQDDNSPPLLSGPAPAVAIQLDSIAPPSSPTPPPPVSPPPVTPPPGVDPPVTDPSPVSGPPTADPSPISGTSPIDPPSSGTDPSSALTPAAAAAAIAIPSQLQSGPTGFGLTSTDVGALAAGPMGGVVAPAAATGGATQLAQTSTAVTQSPLFSGLVAMSTSLHVLEPGQENVAAPTESVAVADLLDSVGDPLALLARFRELGERSLELAAGIGALARSRAAAIAEDQHRPPPDPATGDGADSAAARGEAVQPTAIGVEARAWEAPDGEARPKNDRARTVFLAFTGLAMGAYARCRGLLRRPGRRRDRASVARPGMGPHRPLASVTIGRGQA
jgi:hypothetical protein